MNFILPNPLRILAKSQPFRGSCQYINLFGTKDYESDLFAYVQYRLGVEVEYIDELREIRHRLLPIAINMTGKDQFMMVLKEGEDYSTVIRLTDGEIERFGSFTEFFEAMIDYNKEDLEELLEDD